WRASGLNDVYIFATHVFVNTNANFAVSETFNGDVTKRDTQSFRDFFGELWGGRERGGERVTARKRERETETERVSYRNIGAAAEDAHVFETLGAWAKPHRTQMIAKAKVMYCT